MTTISPKLFFALLFLLSCTQKQQDKNRKGYEIIGNVKNIAAHSVYMNAMVLDSAGQPKWPAIDSADYMNGGFILKRDTQLIEPAWSTNLFYIDSITKKNVGLAFNNRYFSTKEKPSLYASIILENARMTIDGDMKDKHGLALSGANETDFDFHYGLMNPPLELDRLRQKIEAGNESGDTTGMASYKLQENNLLQSYKNNFKKIIDQHPSYFEALRNTYENANNFTPDELQAFADVLDKDLLNLPTGKKLIEFIEQGKKLLTASPFPDFNYKDTLGEQKTLNDVKGKNGTLIVFWASWCGPCRAEIPELKKFYEEYHSKEISVVSISVDNNAEAWRKALVKEQMPWTNLSNLPSHYADINSRYNIQAIPLMFFLDGNDKILLANATSIEPIKKKLAEKGIQRISLSHLQ